MRAVKWGLTAYQTKYKSRSGGQGRIEQAVRKGIVFPVKSSCLVTDMFSTNSKRHVRAEFVPFIK